MPEDRHDANQNSLDAMLVLDHPRKMASAEWAATTLPSVQQRDGWIVDRDTWLRAAEFGVQGLMAPVAIGGSACSSVDAMLTFEGLGAGGADNGVAFALAAQTVTVQRALADSGTPDQQRRWLAPLVAGRQFGAFAMSEAHAGSDPWDMSTRATLQDDGSYVLDGTKSWVTLGPICDVAVVFAVTDPTKGKWGITAFVVDTNLEGCIRGPAIEKMGMHSCPFGDLVLTGCRVEATSVLGRAGSGAAIFGRVVEGERAFLYAAQVGAMERILHRTIERARTRHQSGRHIGSFQAVSHRIVEMKLRHEAARLLLYKAAALADRNQSMSMAAALAKLQTAETGADSMLDAIRVFGAYGYTTEAGLEQELRDIVAGFSYSGTHDIARNVVASLLRIDRAQSTATQPPTSLQ